MRVTTAFLLAAVSQASASVPAWETCSLSSRPKAQALKGELGDAKLVTANAMRLHAFAKEEQAGNKSAAALSDEADAKKQLKEASQETATVEAAVVKKAKAGAVQAVDADALTGLLSSERHVLIVFYAPWCPHCQEFVMADNAPLEDLNTRIVEADKSMGPDVVKFDVDESKVPAGFEVTSIPTIYLHNHGTGANIAYSGQPDLDSLEAWALNGGIAPIKEMPMITVLAAKAKKAALLLQSPSSSWSSMNDAFSGMQGKPTRDQSSRKASVLAVQRRQKQVVEQQAEKEAQLEAASPLSQLSLAPDSPTLLVGKLGSFLN